MRGEGGGFPLGFWPTRTLSISPALSFTPSPPLLSNGGRGCLSLSLSYAASGSERSQLPCHRWIVRSRAEACEESKEGSRRQQNERHQRRLRWS